MWYSLIPGRLKFHLIVANKIERRQGRLKAKKYGAKFKFGPTVRGVPQTRHSLKEWAQGPVSFSSQ